MRRTVCRGDLVNVCCDALPCVSSGGSLGGLILNDAFFLTGMIEISGGMHLEKFDLRNFFDVVKLLYSSF